MQKQPLSTAMIRLLIKVLRLKSLQLSFDYRKLKKKTTHLTGSSSSYIDLMFTLQPNLVMKTDIQASLHPNCHHQNVFAKFNLKLYHPAAL